MKLAFKVATRFLRTSLGQTTLIVFGITMGVAVQIFIGSLIMGLQASLVDTTIGSSSQITIVGTKSEPNINDYQSIIQKINNENFGITASVEVLQTPALVEDGDLTYSILLRGVDFHQVDEIYDLSNRLQGQFPSVENEVVIGNALAKELNKNLGDSIEVLQPSGGFVTYKITGIFDLNVNTLNESWVFTTLPTVQAYLQVDDVVNAIEFQVNDVFKADEIASDIAALTSNQYVVKNWKVENASLLTGLTSQSASSYMIQFFVLLSVVLAIASVLAVSVVQKSKQMGILKAMGISNKKASLIFLFEGLILGVFGAALGIALGLGLTYAFATFVVKPDGTAVVPVLINYGFIGFSACIAIISSTIAALIPARKVAKLDPIEVIRNG